MNLVLKYKLSGENQFCCRGANRITIGDRGGLTVYAAGGDVERLELENFHVVSIAPVDSALNGTMLIQ